MFYSDQTNFVLSGQVNRQNCRYWATENRNWIQYCHTQHLKKKIGAVGSVAFASVDLVPEFKMTNTDQFLDSILEKLGHFGKYQCFVVGLFSIATILHTAVRVTFIFTTKDLNYRCKVPYCETPTSEYNSSWLQNAIPIAENRPLRCERFAHVNTTECNDLDFNKSIVEKCDGYVYETEKITIIQDFNLHCDENVWKLTLIGTLNGMGHLIGLPIAGYVSDRYGRRITLVWGLALAGICGIIRSCTTTYLLFAIFEFLNSLFGAGIYSCAFILGAELVIPKRRVLTSVLISCSYPLGEVLTGTIAWTVQSWRLSSLIVCGALLTLISYYWIVPESVRWMLIKKKYKQVKQALRKVAKVNGQHISEERLEELCSITNTEVKSYPIKELVKSWILVLRFLNCCLCWITCVFVFYGLTINSVALSSNSYLDFILTALVEIPGYVTSYFIVDKIGRRVGISSTLILTSVCCVAFVFIPTDFYWLKLSTYLFGKFAATTAFSICYIITTEIFPTCLRHSLMSTCSMFGRIGASVAPQMPLLAQFWKPLPLILFAVISAISGVFSLYFPETNNVKLPDTIQEAEEIDSHEHKKYLETLL